MSSVCSDVEIEPIHRDILGEQLSRAFNRTPDVRLDIHTGGFRKRQCAAAHTRTRNPNRSLKYMRTRRSANIPEEYLMWKREHSPLWFSQHRVRWGLIDRAHSLKERKAIFHSHLLDKSSCFVFSFAICSCLFKRFQEH